MEGNVPKYWTTDEMNEKLSEYRNTILKLSEEIKAGEDVKATVGSIQRQLKDFKKLVSDMRTAQITYFAAPPSTRAKQEWLSRSKQLEKMVDNELAKDDTPQTNLFG